MPSLTERRHRQARAEIAEAAIALFTERGFDAVTMDDVATASGASRRTVYRHFPRKDDLVFEHPRAWGELFDELVADVSVAGLDRCLHALRAVAARIDATADSVFVAYQVYLSTPSLRGSRGRLDDEFFARFYALAEADLPDDDDRTLDAAVIAGTLVGALNGAIVAWVLHWPDRRMTQLVERALTRIDPVLQAHRPANSATAGSTRRRQRQERDS